MNSESSGRYFNLYARNLPEKSYSFFPSDMSHREIPSCERMLGFSIPNTGQRKKEHLTINRAAQECKISLKLKPQTITSLISKQRGQHEQHRFSPWR